MWQLTTLLTISLMIGGCTTVHYNPDTRDIDVSIPPWGRQFKKLKAEIQPDGSAVLMLEDYNSEEVGNLAYGISKGIAEGIGL